MILPQAIRERRGSRFCGSRTIGSSWARGPHRAARSALSEIYPNLYADCAKTISSCLRCNISRRVAFRPEMNFLYRRINPQMTWCVPGAKLQACLLAGWSTSKTQISRGPLRLGRPNDLSPMRVPSVRDSFSLSTISRELDLSMPLSPIAPAHFIALRLSRHSCQSHDTAAVKCAPLRERICICRPPFNDTKRRSCREKWSFGT